MLSLSRFFISREVNRCNYFTTLEHDHRSFVSDSLGTLSGASASQSEILDSATTFSSRSAARGTLLEEYLHQQRATNELYWNDPGRVEDNLETRWPSLRVKPRADYFEPRNTLLISPSLVSFLSAMMVGLDPLVVPVLGTDVVRALLNVVVASQRSEGAGETGSRAAAQLARHVTRRREDAMRCLAEQYANVTGDRRAWPRLRDELFFDSAVVEPLFELYRVYLAKYPELRDGPNIPELPGKNSLELFFVNYAVAHCEHSPRSVDVAASTDGERALSPAARLNVALMNSRAFAAVFHCKDDDLMNPRSRCEIW
ncbi:uncharacterized protein [Dermacentor andersoni]|uniref:uncharacterized protein n=1 Tax=Dermacentor andersoni TaxID=34620 RepID=UPI0021552F7E|nr:uncharacterized protein LOC126524637 [Dermacentor andersoni]